MNVLHLENRSQKSNDFSTVLCLQRSVVQNFLLLGENITYQSIQQYNNDNQLWCGYNI